MPKKKHAAKRTLYLCAGWSQVTWDCCISGMSNHLSIQVLQVIQHFRAVIIFASMISVEAKLHPREAFGRCCWRIHRVDCLAYLSPWDPRSAENTFWCSSNIPSAPESITLESSIQRFSYQKLCTPPFFFFSIAICLIS
jgi:hypothetical protein